VRALRKGWIKRDRDVAAREPETYLMWEDDLHTEDKTLAGAPAICVDCGSASLCSHFAATIILCLGMRTQAGSGCVRTIAWGSSTLGVGIVVRYEYA